MFASRNLFQAGTLTVPSVPTIGTATIVGAGTASVEFFTSSYNGGTPITSYTVIASQSGIDTNITASGTSSPITITGLTPGSYYAFKIKANNSIGSSQLSDASNTVLTWQVPDAPTMGSATITDVGTARISYAAPNWDGGSPIVRYLVSAYVQPQDTVALTAYSNGSPHTMSGLNEGTSYKFRVSADNSVGSSNQSAPSGTVTTWSRPGIPGNVTASATGSTTASVSFTAPNNGGTPISQYLATSVPGNKQGFGTSSPISIGGLSPNTSYSIYVRASNAVGWGNYGISNTITTSAATTVPGAPTNASATLSAFQATITWTAPTDTGGSPITSYKVVSVPGNLTVQGTAYPLTLSGLSPNTSYTFKVSAINAVGEGATTTTPAVTTTSAVPVTFVVVGGGGGSGGGASYPGGGGGAGGYISSVAGETSGAGWAPVAVQNLAIGETCSVTVGGGGAGAMIGNNGSSSILSSTAQTITAYGGGGGTYATTGKTGGSGGGSRGTGGTPFISGQGSTGGGSTSAAAGGGGGAGQAGFSGYNYVGGNGGNGIQSYITGTATYRAGGGGGACSNGGNTGEVQGIGGLGGGGNGSYRPTWSAATPGAANTGGGAGGAGETGGYAFLDPVAAGGSGVVILRFPSTRTYTTTGSPSVTTVGSDRVLIYSGSGSLTITG